MTKYAIQVENLGKEYIIGAAEQRHDSFREMLTGALTSPLRKLRKLGGTASDIERFWALKDVSFNVEQGEVLGIIGRNGAGKSTLLKILSRITDPTEGRVSTRGRMASLLEVGTGFHPELTGRENIYLNGAILGMSRSAIQRRFDEIVEFAEIERFLDTPVKRYSSGMYVRLAFAVAAHLETDVLLVDEVLAVGDTAFQRKSLGKMGDVAKGGKTVFFVSHNLAAVRNLCSRVLTFERGTLSFDGSVGEGLSNYERSFASRSTTFEAAEFHGPLANQLNFIALIYKQGGEVVDIIDPTLDFKVELHGVAHQNFATLDLKFSLFRDGVYISSCHDTLQEAAMSEGSFISVYELPGNVLRSGRYSIGIGASGSIGSWIWGQDVAVMDFSENRGGRSTERTGGIVAIPYVGKRIQNF